MDNQNKPPTLNPLARVLLGYYDFSRSANSALAQRALNAIGKPVDRNDYYQPVTRAGDAAYGLMMPAIVENVARPNNLLPATEQRASQHTPEGMWSGFTGGMDNAHMKIKRLLSGQEE